MGYGDLLNQLGRTGEVQALYQQSLMQSDLELRQAERRLSAQRKQQEETVQEGLEVQPKQPSDLELSHRQTPRAKYGPGRFLDISA